MEMMDDDSEYLVKNPITPRSWSLRSTFDALHSVQGWFILTYVPFERCLVFRYVINLDGLGGGKALLNAARWTVATAGISTLSGYSSLNPDLYPENTRITLN